MNQETLNVMICSSGVIFLMFVALVVKDYLFTKSMDKLLDKHDALWEKYCGKQK